MRAPVVAILPHVTSIERHDRQSGVFIAWTLDLFRKIGAMALTTSSLDHFRQQLIAHAATLSEEIRDGMTRSKGEDGPTELTGAVGDAGDKSVGFELADLRSAHIERDTVELDQVVAALARMDHGAYGTCVDCGMEIELPRLHARPMAMRCMVCQEQYERSRFAPHARL